MLGLFSGRHHVLDVLAGAVIGIVVAQLLLHYLWISESNATALFFTLGYVL